VVLERVLARRADEAYLLLRVLCGLMFTFHGLQKVFGIFTAHQPEVGSQIWMGGVIEVVAGLAIAVGFLTSWAAFLSSGTMAVAYLQFHWRLAVGKDFIPTLNKGELAVVYALVFLYIACRGGGRFSFDALRTARTQP
jgi:putative oxidoreductase